MVKIRNGTYSQWVGPGGGCEVGVAVGSVCISMLVPHCALDG